MEHVSSLFPDGTSIYFGGRVVFFRFDVLFFVIEVDTASFF
jgi:hypothetical protein